MRKVLRQIRMLVPAPTIDRTPHRTLEVREQNYQRASPLSSRVGRVHPLIPDALDLLAFFVRHRHEAQHCLRLLEVLMPLAVRLDVGRQRSVEGEGAEAAMVGATVHVNVAGHLRVVALLQFVEVAHSILGRRNGIEPLHVRQIGERGLGGLLNASQIGPCDGAYLLEQAVASMPEYSFDGPGMVPFARDPDNFWYRLSKIALTQASPGMYVRRLRWAGEILNDLEAAGVSVSKLTRKSLLRECNAIKIDEADGLNYLRAFFDTLFANLAIDFRLFTLLREHHDAFFESSQVRIEKLKKEGTEIIGDIATFRKVFQSKSGITISTIHGIKGAEFDAVIAYALLENVLPNRNDPNGQESAMKLLYVIGSRARKNLHLISERERIDGYTRDEYQATLKLAACDFEYDQIP
jgi:hypothetical protein